MLMTCTGCAAEFHAPPLSLLSTTHSPATLVRFNPEEAA